MLLRLQKKEPQPFCKEETTETEKQREVRLQRMQERLASETEDAAERGEATEDVH